MEKELNYNKQAEEIFDKILDWSENESLKRPTDDIINILKNISVEIKQKLRKKIAKKRHYDMDTWLKKTDGFLKTV